ncbi:hypothetical protein Gotri_022803, partial [Gossypium trilobum]|nr:hypothetical protein [Gossypium trilobum]
MKVKGCNVDIVHYNTVILGFCRKGIAMDAIQKLKDRSCWENNGGRLQRKRQRIKPCQIRQRR